MSLLGAGTGYLGKKGRCRLCVPGACLLQGGPVGVVGAGGGLGAFHGSIPGTH